MHKNSLSGFHVAFTLAEQLLVIGIIGIVAAFTIASLIQNSTKNQIITGLKKEYVTLIQAFKQSEVDNGSSADWDWGAAGDAASIKTQFQSNLAPYLRIINYCNDVGFKGCGYKNNNFYYNKTIVGACVTESDQVSVLLADGSLLIVRVRDQGGGNIEKMIFIDINGAKNPNIYGIDFFAFEVNKSKGIVPYLSTAGTGYINGNCGGGDIYDGNSCAAKIITIDNWQIKDDYPWKQ